MTFHQRITRLEHLLKNKVGSSTIITRVATGEVEVPEGEFDDTYLIDGGESIWVENFDFSVSAANYKILGITYHSDPDDVTLSAADPALPRIDVIAVDINGQVVVIEGTPDANPVKPYVDPETQLELTFIAVGAGTTQPSDGYIFTVYTEDEAPDFLTTESHASIVSNSVASPRSGTKSIEFTNSPVGSSIILRDDGTPADTYAGTYFLMYVKSKGGWGNGSNAKRLVISMLNDTDQVIGAPVILRSSGTYGFDAGNATDYQQVAIPMSDFINGIDYATGELIYGIKIAVSGSQGSMGCYIDDISFNLYKGVYNSGRFGVDGEDTFANEDRSFNYNSRTFTYTGLANDNTATNLLALDGAGKLVYREYANENPFTVLSYRDAEPHLRDFFTNNGLTLNNVAASLVGVGAGGNITMTASQFVQGAFWATATASGTYNVTMPLAADLLTALAQTQGTGQYFDFSIVNDGSGTVNLIVNTGITAMSAITGGTNLAVTTGTVGVFRLVLRGGNSPTITLSRIL